MTPQPPPPPLDDRVSRPRYERERRARVEAEALLEAKSTALYEANQKLVLDSQSLRAALAETEALRQREAVALRERTILSEALTALSGQGSAAVVMQALLACLRTQFDIFDACYLQAHGDGVRIAASARQDHAGLILPLPASVLTQARRLSGLGAASGDAVLPGGTREYRAVIIAPLSIPGEGAGALMLGCKRAARFASGDLRLLMRVAEVAVPTLVGLREARRNALLAGLLEGRAIPDEAGVLDAPLEAVHRAFSRLTDMQGQVVGILDALLTAPLSDADPAIDQALARMGRLAGMDRTYVFRLRADGDLIDNSHEWCAPGIAPMQAGLQAIPVAMIDHWRAAFEAGDDVIIPDLAALPDDAPEKSVLMEQGIRSLLAVPMMQDGQFRGFVGYDAVRDLRSFLPGEAHLIRSVAKVILSVLSRRDAEDALLAAHAETTAQRARLEAVLSAMPDLILEIDPAGRFVTWYSGAVALPDVVVRHFEDRLLEDALPPDLAAAGRKVMADIDAGKGTVSLTFPFALGDWPRWWQLSAVGMGAEGYLFVMRDITEAREQTAEIERLSEIARRTTNLVVVTDAARRIEWVNAAFERTTGWPLDEVKGRNAGSFLQTEAADPATIARMRTALDAGQSVQAEILNRARNGREYWVALDIQPLNDADGALQGFLAVETDVTDRRQQAEALRQSAEAATTARTTLEAAVGALQDGFVLFDASDRLVICNERYREIYARSAPAIVVGATYESILRYGLEQGDYADGIGREAEWLAERVSRHHLPDNEFEQVLADGRCLRIFDKATANGGRVGLRVDITALKLAEKRALADLSTAMEASQDGIAITDAEGNYLFMNKAHLALFGYETEAEVIGKPWTALYAPEQADWMRSHAMPLFFANGHWAGEVPGRARDCSPVDQDVSLTLKEDGGILCIVRDMTDRRREATERARLNDELQLAQRREIIGQIAAGLAHDFNNLLATISGSAALIEMATPPGTPAATGARRIQSASDQAAGLVKRLLSLGARQTDPVQLDLRKPLLEAAELVRASLRAPARLTVTAPDDPVPATADPTDLMQVVLNLGINARDALDGQAGDIRLTLAAASKADLAGPFSVGRPDPARAYYCLTIADSGPGMGPDLAAQVFKPYFSTKGEQGTGLGLAIVATVVSSNGGAISLETAPGLGTTFRVLWPADAGPAPVAPSPLVGLTGRLDGRAVLVVDDQEDVLAIITAFLEAAGAEVAPSTDPADVIDALRDDPAAWDLLVTDFDMPGMSGADLAASARALVPGLPVILVTALAGVAGRSGDAFDAVLGKPVQSETLVSAAEIAILRAKSKE